MPAANNPDPTILRALLRLDEDTGRLFWRERPLSMFSGTSAARARGCWNSKWAGREAFTSTLPKGHKTGKLLDRGYLAHRIVWAMHTGRWPDGQVDHINHDPADNRPSNLRVVSNMENHRNMRLNSANTSGAMGVFWQKNRLTWNAHIMVAGRSIHLGAFRNKDAAILARRKAEELYGFHQNHGRVAA